MKTPILSLLLMATTASLCLAQPGNPQSSGLIPRTPTIDINTNFNNTSTESQGVAIAANGNVLIGWEDDNGSIQDYEAVWTLYSGAGVHLTPDTVMTNAVLAGLGYIDTPESVTNSYLSFFRSDGTPTPGSAAWGPKIKANLFGNGLGMGATAFYLGIEVPELLGINVDSGGGGDFPAVQLLNNDGTPSITLPLTGAADTNAEPAGNIRIADWEYLSNGNILIVGESRQADDRALTGQAGGNVPVYRIVTPAGVEVKAYSAVSSTSENAGIWHGVGVTANGFGVRFDAGGATVRLFDNAGNPKTANIKVAALTGIPGTGGGGRGDGTGFHGNGADAYVIANSSGEPYVTVLNANGTLRYSRKVADAGETIASDRIDAAIAPDGRVIVVFGNSAYSGGTYRLVEGKMFDPCGAAVAGSFWVSERDDSTNAVAAADIPRVAWRGNTIAVAWQSLNSPATLNKVISFRLFDVTPSLAVSNFITARTVTFDVNTNFNNTSTESQGVAIAANGNVLIGWEDDNGGIQDYEAVWTLYDANGVHLTPDTVMTNAVLAGLGYIDTPESVNNSYLSFFRSNGTPTPGSAAWGPKIKANLFGNGLGMGATAFYLGIEVPELFNINVDAGGGGDFPALQLLNNNGTPSISIPLTGATDANAEPAGNIRIGDWEQLSNGNIVIVGESRQDDDRNITFGPLVNSGENNVAVYRVVTSAGVEVRAYDKVNADTNRTEIWHGVGVTANGYGVRFRKFGRAHVRLFDNAGNPTSGDIDLAALTGIPGAGGGSRGDGAAFHGNGKDAYVHAATSGGMPYVTVLNADGTVRYSRQVADPGVSIAGDRIDAAIAPDGRVIVVYGNSIGSPGTYRLVQARLFAPNGNVMGDPFYVSERDNPANAVAGAETPRVAWRNNLIAVAWQSDNSPATLNTVIAMRLFNVAAPLTLSISPSHAISWPVGGHLESAPEAAGPWTAVEGATSPYTPAITGDRMFFRVCRPY